MNNEKIFTQKGKQIGKYLPQVSPVEAIFPFLPYHLGFQPHYPLNSR